MNREYDQALHLVQQIEDDDFRTAARDAIIKRRVHSELGYDDPSCALSMQLRREAMAKA
jgi:hypothetical protein